MKDFNCQCGSQNGQMMYPMTFFVQCLDCGLVYVKDSMGGGKVKPKVENDSLVDIKKELAALRKEIKILKTFKRRL